MTEPSPQESASEPIPLLSTQRLRIEEIFELARKKIYLSHALGLLKDKDSVETATLFLEIVEAIEVRFQLPSGGPITECVSYLDQWITSTPLRMNRLFSLAHPTQARPYRLENPVVYAIFAVMLDAIGYEEHAQMLALRAALSEGFSRGIKGAADFYADDVKQNKAVAAARRKGGDTTGKRRAEEKNKKLEALWKEVVAAQNSGRTLDDIASSLRARGRKPSTVRRDMAAIKELIKKSSTS